MIAQVLYRYPDTGDRVTGTFIERHEPYPGYWSGSEDRALDRLGTELSRLLPPRAGLRALDAGCGEGRLTGRLARFAAHVTAADPDPDRLAVAREWVRPEQTETDFVVAPVTGIGGGPYDLVLCSHVIQHVPTGDVTPLLAHLHEICAEDALLALSYSRAPVGRGAFTLDSLGTDGYRSRPVGQAEFDRALRETPDTATLPVRLLDPEEVTVEAARAGWATVWEWTYHVLDDVETAPGEDRDEVVNRSPALRRELGRDHFALLRRSAR